ncbi:MAG: SRPBCC domain-containing protein, partial [Acidimicrobiia bacterium]
MTTPDRPLRMELTFEMPGTAEQVWDAIATANGISSWFMPTDMESRVGGAVCFHMGEDASEGTITEFDAPRRIVYEEPDWAGLSGHKGAEVTPLVSEFIVEAQAGGTCVVRVVSSAFGTGADWEQEFFD